MKKILLTTATLLLISFNLTAGNVQVKIIKNHPDQYTNFLEANVFIDGRFGAMMKEMDLGPSSASAFGPNLGVGFSYRFRPKFLIGFMFDADISPLDFMRLMTSAMGGGPQTAFKAWDFVLTGGLLFQVYDSSKKRTSRMIVRSSDMGAYIINYYIDVPNTIVRNVFSIRVGAMAEYNNMNMLMDEYNNITWGDPIAHTSYEQQYLAYIGISWFEMRSLVIDILDDGVAERYGRRHDQFYHIDIYFDVIADTSTLDIGARIGMTAAFQNLFSVTLECGYTPNKAAYAKITAGLNFSISNGTTNNQGNTEKKPKSFEM